MTTSILTTCGVFATGSSPLVNQTKSSIFPVTQVINFHVGSVRAMWYADVSKTLQSHLRNKSLMYISHVYRKGAPHTEHGQDNLFRRADKVAHRAILNARIISI